MLLEFEVREHFGRVDLYPTNEAARLIIDYKRKYYSKENKIKVKCISPEELELFKALGHEVRLVKLQDFEKLKKQKGA